MKIETINKKAPIHEKSPIYKTDLRIEIDPDQDDFIVEINKDVAMYPADRRKGWNLHYKGSFYMQLFVEDGSISPDSKQAEKEAEKESCVVVVYPGEMVYIKSNTAFIYLQMAIYETCPLGFKKEQDEN